MTKETIDVAYISITLNDYCVDHVAQDPHVKKSNTIIL